MSRWWQFTYTPLIPFKLFYNLYYSILCAKLYEIFYLNIKYIYYLTMIITYYNYSEKLNVRIATMI